MSSARKNIPWRDVLGWYDALANRRSAQISTISVDGLRSFMAVLGDQDVGNFVSTGGFTRDAESEARIQEKSKVTLIDLERLFELWVQHYDRIAESDRRLLPLKPVYYLAPSE